MSRQARWRTGLRVILFCACVACSANAIPDATQTVVDPSLLQAVTSTSDATDTAEATTIEQTTTSVVATTIVPARPEGSFTMAFSGDTLIHRPIVRQAATYAGGNGYDFAPMFARIAPLVSSVDLGVCHMETPVAPPGEELSGHPIYGVPVQVLAGVASAGYDRCSSASNHTLDRGLKGIDATVNGLEAAGLGNSGMARTPAESEPQVFVVRGVRMSHLAYTWGFNGIPMPAGNEWRAKLIDQSRIVADARVARSRGAEFVFVSIHWGEEKNWRVTKAQRQVAEFVTASGQVDLIVGHHVHVLQPIEQINGRWVVFGLSNIISNLPGGDLAWPASSQDGAVVTIDVARSADGGWVVDKPVVHPTWVDPAGYLIRLVADDLKDPATPEAVAVHLRNSLERSRTVLGEYFAS